MTLRTNMKVYRAGSFNPEGRVIRLPFEPSYEELLAVLYTVFAPDLAIHHLVVTYRGDDRDMFFAEGPSHHSVVNQAATRLAQEKVGLSEVIYGAAVLFPDRRVWFP